MKKQQSYEELLEERRNTFKKIYKNTFGQELKILPPKNMWEDCCPKESDYYGIRIKE